MTKSIFLYLLWFALLSNLLGCTKCHEEILNSVASPDGKWVAVILTKDCDATTKGFVGVNIRVSDSSALRSENYVFVAERMPGIAVSWKTNDIVVVDCPGCRVDDVKKKATQLGGLHIEYRLGG